MDQEEEDPPPRLFTPLYWAALAFGLAMILAGAAVGLFGDPAGSPHHVRAPAHARGRALTAHRVRGKEPTESPKARSPETHLTFQHEVLVGQSRSGDQAGLPKLPSQVL